MTNCLSETWSIYIVFKPQSIGIKSKKTICGLQFPGIFLCQGVISNSEIKTKVDGQSRYTGAVKMPRENLHNQVALTRADNYTYMPVYLLKETSGIQSKCCQWNLITNKVLFKSYSKELFRSDGILSRRQTRCLSSQ